MTKLEIEKSWKKYLEKELDKEYWEPLTNFVKDQYKNGVAYPPPKDIFRAMNMCPFEKVKVVIIGQDPYHGKGQANGLCFAVNDGIDLPPSLKNIFKEIESDLKIETIKSGDLTRFAKQGVLLLNSVLTVTANKPASHAGKGWEIFTDAIVNALNKNRKNIVYLLWGKYAQNKGLSIDRENNLVLTSGHPSPFSATLFFGNHHFSQCNEYLKKNKLDEIDWK